MGPVRFGLVGAGVIGKQHAACLATLRGGAMAELVATADENMAAASAIAERFGGVAIESVDELLARSDVEAVCVCTPSGLHAAIGVAAAAAGKHVLVEKPIDVTLEAADRLIAACRDAGVRLGVVSQRRFEPGVRRLKAALDAGRLGRLILGEASVKWYRSPAYYASAGWRATRELDGGGALINQAIHTIDLLRWCMGEVATVTAAATTLVHDIPVEDLAVALLRFRNGALGTIVGSTAIFPGLPQRLEVHGEDGSIGLTDGTVTLWALRDEMGPVGDYGTRPPAPPDVTDTGTVAGSHSAHCAQIADFAVAVREGRAPLVTGEDNRASLRLILAIYEAARTGREVYVDG